MKKEATSRTTNPNAIIIEVYYLLLNIINVCIHCGISHIFVIPINLYSLNISDAISYLIPSTILQLPFFVNKID